MTVEQITEPNRSSTSTAPAGYKQTELGIIPEDWCVSPIGQTHILATGTTPPTANTANYGDRYLFVSPADLGEAKYVLKTEKRLSERGFKLARQYPSGSTLFTCIGSTIGKTGLSREILTSNQQINAIFPSNDSDPEFVYYAVTHIAPRVKALAGQQAVPLVNKSEFGETLYCYPSSKTEQTAIANALSDVDALIQELEKLIAKKQAIKTATMQQLLTGRTRLPQFAHHPNGRKKGYKPSEIGEIPEDWRVLKLIDIATFINGKPYEEFVVENGKYQLITLDSVSISGVLKNKHKTVNFVDGSLSKGDLVCVLSDIAHARLLGLCGLIEDDGQYVLNQRMGRIRFHVDFHSEFMRYLINSKQEFFRNRGQGSSQRHIYKQDVFELELALPEKSEQVSIATVLSEMDQQIRATEQRLSKTRQIKQGMMQELLTGKTRLVKPAGAA
ncbi:restriction endonuclease subunit S [Shewanella xiamenensis]|uniref:Restriction endonuclease subunit S n=1 Tax=Shewanella xiamenensis TaxID=332186 RepID=A0AAE4TPG2_9GAMM|nr:restriction endonuclease subunit S [Shewanella xiamenensis]MDV5392110.1 restriction endonuclease subunit S [Shewanella xiamenensis]